MCRKAPPTVTTGEKQGTVGTEGTKDGGRGASPPIVMVVDLVDPSKVQLAVERM